MFDSLQSMDIISNVDIYIDDTKRDGISNVACNGTDLTSYFILRAKICSGNYWCAGLQCLEV